MLSRIASEVRLIACRYALPDNIHCVKAECRPELEPMLLPGLLSLVWYLKKRAVFICSKRFPSEGTISHGFHAPEGLQDMHYLRSIDALLAS